MTTSLIASANGTLNVKGEHDWFRVTLDANTLYAVDIPDLADMTFAGISLYRANGSPSDLVYTSYSGATAFMEETAGTYYIDVGAYYSSTQFTDYTVNLSTSPDDYRNNTSTSGTIAVGSSSSGNIDIAGDHDWFQVSLTANTLYAITASIGTISLEMVDSSGQALDTTDAQGAGALGFMPATSGTYYIDASSATAGAYTINVATATDDYKNNTTTSGTVSVGGSSSGTINIAGDHDWFAVELSANTLYALSATGLDAADSGMFGVYDANGDATDAFWATADGTQGFMTDTSGTYYVEVSSSTPAAYTLSVATSTDDYRNNTSTSGTVNVGGTAGGTLNLASDHDWFQVNLTANTLYEITTSGLAISIPGFPDIPAFPSGFLQVRDGNGESLPTIDSYGATGQLGFMPTTSGSYFIDVSNFYQTGQNAYTLSVGTSSDDYRNNTTTTGTVSVGGTASGTINVVGDHDWFAVNLQADTLYEISTTGLESSGTSLSFLEIYDANGLPAPTLDSLGTGFLGFMPASSGTYYIDVGSLLLTGTGAYTLEVAVSQDDYENNIRTDGVLTVAAQPPTDTTAPTVFTILPADDASDIAIATDIVVTFSEPIQRGSGNITLKTAGGTTVATYDAATSSNLLISGNVLTINPEQELANGTEYQLEFDAGSLADLANNPYAGSTSYSFTTIAAINAAPTLATPSPIAYTDTSQADVFIEASGMLAGDDNDDDSLSYGIADGIDQGNGTVSLAGTYGTLLLTKASGAYTFFPDDSTIQGLKSATSESFTVTVSDGSETANAVLTVNVAAADDAPTLSQSIANANATIDQAFTLTLPSDTFADADDTSLSYSATLANDAPLPNWLSFDPATRTFSGTAGSEDAGELEIRVTAGDASSNASDTFLLTIGSTPIEGIVADGYIAGASLFIDVDGDGVADPEESTGATTDSAGNFSLQTNLVGPIIAIGGTNIDTGLPNTLQLSAPAGSTVINPLTTLVQNIVTQQDIPVADAEALAQTALGITADVDLTQYDPLAAGTPEAVSIQQLAAQVAVVATLAPSGDTSFASIAAALIAAGSQVVDLGNTTVLQGILPGETGEVIARIAQINQSLAETDSLSDISDVQEASLNDSNDAPILLSPLVDQRTAHDRSTFSYTIAENSFTDLDTADQLTYSATLGDGSALPAWLSFNAGTLTFSGTPDNLEAGTLAIRVTATDTGALSTSDQFSLTLGAHQTGTTGKDSFSGSSGDDSFDGSTGIDLALFQGRHAAYALTGANNPTTLVNDLRGDDGIDELSSTERLGFADAHLAFDTDGNAGQVYRLYKAAFARTPDLAGLGNWIAAMDNGQTLEQIASSFASSTEFQTLYGSNSSNDDFVKLLYLNALGRAPETGGISGWSSQLASGAISRAQLLAQFSESTENKNAVLERVEHGIFYATAAQAEIATNGLTLAGTSAADSLYGSVAGDRLTGGAGNDVIHGGAGVDTAVYGAARAGYTISQTLSGLTVSGGTEGSDTLVDVERLAFSDSVLAFDVNGNAGQVYRLYQAAFDRTPDIGGLTDWIHGMDDGMTLLNVAKGFIASDEFKTLYGTAPTDDTFVNLLYQNVLNRAPDEGGRAYWMDELSRGMTREMALIGFSESGENQAAVIGVIENGIQLNL